MDIPSGCSFHPRCPEVFQDCYGTEPVLYDVGEARRSACLLVRGAKEEATT
jgi:ABC-type dipeptide/oligopeptide/nickel transport system ATPase component